MPITAGTRTMPILLSNQRADYAAAFTRLQSDFGLPLAK
jgi:ATP adenylyltransferase